MPKTRLFRVLEHLVRKMLPVSRLLGSVPIIGERLRRLVPVANYFGILPLNEKQQLEWALLDTFDWLSPQYDNPQKPHRVESWLQMSGLRCIEVFKTGHLVGRGVK